MLEIHERLSRPAEPRDFLTLPFELRQRSRLKAQLDSGEPVGLFLPRGTVLRGNDLLLASNGLVIRVKAARETLSLATTDNPLLLARACYHLGNRHLPVQIGTGWLSYPADHVLDEMVRGLGLTVAQIQAPFEPETGAYHGPNHHHDH
ncbi:MAG: urease accessory protein UreE [Candidatus Competibacteraceae bacterium]|nr:urease accessory protein UreE [Candidatus Competibacteraceae bacterium]